MGEGVKGPFFFLTINAVLPWYNHSCKSAFPADATNIPHTLKKICVNTPLNGDLK